MAQYTTLDAVNLMLEAIGDPHVSALETGQDTVAGDAESKLDKVTREIQAQEWACNTVDGYENEVPTITIPVSAVVGTFRYDETVTESTSGATGTVKGLISSTLYIVPVSGTFAGSLTLTGSSSSATATGGAVTTVDENYILIDDTNWTRVTRNKNEPKPVVVRGQYLFNTDPDSDGAIFTDSVLLDIVRILYFTDLPYNLAAYVAAEAALQFARWKKRSNNDDPILRDNRNRARLEAIREDNDSGQYNILQTAEARQVKGNRSRDPAALN